jgi:hypothetical protein
MSDIQKLIDTYYSETSTEWKRGVDDILRILLNIKIHDLTNVSKRLEIKMNLEKMILIKEIEELNLTINELRDSYWRLKHPSHNISILKC